MRTLRRFLVRAGAWFTSRRDQERIREEIEDHLARQTADLVRAGVPPTEARRQAVLKFGGLDAATEDWRDQRGLPLVDTLGQDVRYALRRLRSAPVFALTTILTLALGIGATTAIFTLVHAVLLKSLPVANPDELYKLGETSRCCFWGGYSQNGDFSLVSYELYQHFRDNTEGFAELAAFSAGITPLAVQRAGRGDAADSNAGEFVSGNYFTTFGIQAYAGRMLGPADDRPGAPLAAVMSHRLWTRRYGADPAIVGSTYTLEGTPFTIVGIMPPGFFGDTLRSDPPDFFLPLHTEPVVIRDAALPHADLHWLEVIGRVRPGAAATSIEAGMRLELTRWLRSHESEMSANDRAKLSEQTLHLRPGGAGITSLRDAYERWLLILLMVTGCALVIVCANVASLMLVRGLERRRQTSLSLALGAPPHRVIRGPIIESLLLSLAGGGVGLAIAFAGTRVILRLVFPAASAGAPIAAWPSPPVLAFAFVVSLATGLAFGIVPAWMATRADPMDALRGTGRSVTSAGSRPRAALTVAQTALSLALLSMAGLLGTALHGLESQPLGFEPADRIVAHVNPRLSGDEPAEAAVMYERLHEAVRRIPGVTGVALCVYSPFGNNSWGSGVVVDGRPAPGPHDDTFASWDRASAGYFDVIGTPILRGRGITAQDTATSRHVAVVNEAFARKFLDGDPIGKHFGQHGSGSEREYEVIGVARDARYFDFNLDEPIGPMFFLPDVQHDFKRDAPSEDANPGSHILRDIVLRLQPGVHLSSQAVRDAIASVDPALPVASIRPMSEQVADAFGQQRVIARFTLFFGVLSLLLASIGLYGVTAHNAARRTAEIGLRIALGADRVDVVRLILRSALTLIGIGLLLGLPLAAAVGPLLSSQLYGAEPLNPAVLLSAALVLGATGVAACCIPAFRARSTSPADALRAE
jgi:predicted permease